MCMSVRFMAVQVHNYPKLLKVCPHSRKNTSTTRDLVVLLLRAFFFFDLASWHQGGGALGAHPSLILGERSMMLYGLDVMAIWTNL